MPDLAKLGELCTDLGRRLAKLCKPGTHFVLIMTDCLDGAPTGTVQLVSNIEEPEKVRGMLRDIVTFRPDERAIVDVDSGECCPDCTSRRAMN